MEHTLLHRKEGIIISTIEAMNTLGIHNLSTKTIAEFQGISEGTLFRHFKSKSDIFRAVLEYFSQYDNDIIQGASNRKLKPVEAIVYFVNAYAEYYQNYPEITVIINHLDSLLYDPDLADLVKNIVDRRYFYILYEIKKAQHEGKLNANISPELLAQMIKGGFREMCLRWRMQNYNFSLKEQSAIMVVSLLDAFTLKN